MSIVKRIGKDGTPFGWNTSTKRFAALPKGGSRKQRSKGTSHRAGSGRSLVVVSGAAPTRSTSSGKSKSRGGLFGAMKGGAMAQAAAIVPQALVGAGGFLATRIVTGWALGMFKSEDGENRDRGWLGYAVNAGVVIAGYLLLRKFAPKFATAFAIGGGIAIAIRAYDDFTSDEGASSGSAGAGVSGIVRADDGTHGIVRNYDAAA